jgi:hypothetical protein
MPHPDTTLIDRDQIERVVAAMRASKTPLVELLEATDANSIAEMSGSQYVRAMSWLQRRRAEQNASLRVVSPTSTTPTSD